MVGDGYETLLTADYSQIEMRIMAHLSGDEGLIEAFRSGEDLHSYVGSRVFGVPTDEVTPAMRSKIKAMSYGLAYGLSSFGLSQQLSIEVSEAAALMQDYFSRFGGVRDYLTGVVDVARQTGYTATILGRRRYLPDLTSDNRQRREMAERMALNAPIQGSAADLIKVAMLGRRPRADAPRAAARACSCRCTTSSCSRWRRGSGPSSRRSCASRWAPRGTRPRTVRSTCRSTSRSAQEPPGTTPGTDRCRPIAGIAWVSAGSS